MTKLPVLIILTLIIIVGAYFLVGGKNDSIQDLMTKDTIDGLAKIGETALFKNRDIVKGTIRTDKGNMGFEIYPKIAPQTTTVFATLAINHFYDGILIHRVAPDFVVQAGDPLTKEYDLDDPRIGSGGPGFWFKDEINLRSLGAPDEYIKALEAQGYTYQDDVQSILMETGVIAMANSGPDTNGSQFFIVTNGNNARHLNGKHTVFGKIDDASMETVLKLERGDKILGIDIEL